VKKNEMKDQEQNRKPRRLTLSRETIQILNDPALFGVAGGLPQSRENGPGTVCPVI
jgi:hypothetical protein